MSHKNEAINNGLTIVIFTIFDGELFTLTHIRENNSVIFPNTLSLPNGFIDPTKDKSIEDAAHRKIYEKTKFKVSSLEQLKTYSGHYIDPRKWSVVQGFISIVSENDALKSQNKITGEWIKVNELLSGEDMAFNHKEILKDAYARLIAKAEYTNIAVHFLGNEFTLTELQHTYEVLLNAKLDKSTFRSNLRKFKCVDEVPNKLKDTKGRKAKMYLSNGDQIFFPRSISKHSL